MMTILGFPSGDGPKGWLAIAALKQPTTKPSFPPPPPPTPRTEPSGLSLATKVAEPCMSGCTVNPRR